MNDDENLPMSDKEYDEYMKITNKDVSMDDINLICSDIPDSFFEDAVRMFEEYNINED